jgi:hypothetical protein
MTYPMTEWEFTADLCFLTSRGHFLANLGSSQSIPNLGYPWLSIWRIYFKVKYVMGSL